VIKIDNVHKGTLNQSEVVIRFPASTDVRWYRAPKFQPGQQGYFMLHKTQTQEKAPKTPPKAAAKGGAKIATHTAVPMVGAAAPAGEETYTALHPMDFQSYGEQGGISSLLASNNSDEQSG
jgi:hypothetical protein